MGFLSRVFGSPESAAAANVSHATVDVQEASRRQAAGALLIDVREPAEWQQGHAPGATLIPLGSVSGRLADVPRDGDVLLICRSGNRSGSAQRQLLQLGYRRVFNVAGGMNAWSNAGLPVSR
ncbi:MAG: rhodanese-like domain-containing protein [Chloroflexota bacterium]|nr:rhodanese-like domain-containing protein [Chloroflexota bacterium]